MIPYGRQTISAQDRRAVEAALRSPRITQGPLVPRFEEELARYCGARYAVAVSSGTAALHLATLALRLGPGDEVLTSPVSFVATSNAALYAGAKPVFADVEYDTVNLSPERARRKISRKTRALYLTHFAGLPCRMPEFARLARARKLSVVEDAAHALGARYRDAAGRWHRAASCRHSDAAILSFHPVKHITTGEGGAVTTNDRRLYEAVSTLRSHGIVRSNALARRHGPWHYEMRALGFNYRMTDLQAALGLSQLKRADQMLARRREIADEYRALLAGVPGIELPVEPAGFESAYHLYAIKIDFMKIKTTRAGLMRALAADGIGTQVHYIPINSQPYYRELGYRPAEPEAARYFARALSLPMFPAMTAGQVRRVAATVRRRCKR